jgi:hypothetical protein
MTPRSNFCARGQKARPLDVKFDEHDFEVSLMGASRLGEGETVDARYGEPASPATPCYEPQKSPLMRGPLR